MLIRAVQWQRAVSYKTIPCYLGYRRLQLPLYNLRKPGNIMRTARVIFLFLLCVGLCDGVVVHETITYKQPIKKISGRVIGYGNVNPGVYVRVFDKPEVRPDDAQSTVQNRQGQREITSTITDSTGKFEFRHIPRGDYEVEFSTGHGGWNDLSLDVAVDPSGSRGPLCVLMSMEGQGQKPSVLVCRNAISGAHSLVSRVPPPDPETYRGITDAPNWKNPFLIVGPNGVEIRSSGSAPSGPKLPVSKVVGFLERLPESTWLYGLVVAVQENGVIISEDAASRMKHNRLELMRRLSEADVQTELWPST